MLHEKRVNVARGTEVSIKWLKVDWTDFTIARMGIQDKNVKKAGNFANNVAELASCPTIIRIFPN